MTLTKIPLPDLTATELLAKRLAKIACRGDVIALQGPLGAGKTAFARAFILALGITGEVPSPTFTLVQNYDTHAGLLYHFDLYRLKNENELIELGWSDACADGIVLVEWPEHGAGGIPESRLLLNFSMDRQGARFCEILPRGNWPQRLGEAA